MISKVLIIGSGPIIIGQAAEFDYSGTQACLACRDAGVHSILVNSNPATIQTDPHVADTVYIEPLTVPTLTKIIEAERPDGVIATVGGQTALNLAVALEEAGVLERYGVNVLGTGLEAIRRGEDRELFASTIRALGQPVLPSHAVLSTEMGLVMAESLGYPVMCRSAFALGGSGSGLANGPDELERQVSIGLHLSGSGQVLVEKSVYGWTEVEYEVVRDAEDNCLVVCNMENIDPMGIHTGDSIVVAPSQTLSDQQYHLLRSAAIEVVRGLGVEGACNVQFALDHQSGEYYVIEVNPRLSRSSALASKATGYPIAKVATRIALGFSLPEIRNEITGTSAFFEPALDYVTLKIPRWPFDKFDRISSSIGTSMQSTGEVMAIGRTFIEATEKAIRSLDQPQMQDASPNGRHEQPAAERLFSMLAALESGERPDKIATKSRIHPWFVHQLAELASAEKTGRPQRTIFKMVDTCAAEFEARTPYFYSSRSDDGLNEASSLPGPKAIILGAGPIRIGQGIEFDYATVHACQALSEFGVASIIVNNNPETVSTDYSTSDRLYFEPLDLESVMAVVNNERDGLLGVIPQFGGQTAINLVDSLQELGVPILGTQPGAIDAAEDRGQTSALLSKNGIPAPQWRSIHRWADLCTATEEVGFPALLRPSYVLSGQGMTIARNTDDVDRYLEVYSHTELQKPLLIDHFLEGALEVDVDAVADGEDVVMVPMEQLDECGVHSGDSVEVFPVQSLNAKILATIEEYTRQLAKTFGVVGLMNIQYAVLDGTVYVLEVNPRASRSVPFASKASGIPLADLAIRVILGEKLRDLTASAPRSDRVSVKQVAFPFGVFAELPPVLTPSMQSTGESMGSGKTFGEAYWKAWLGRARHELPFGEAVYVSLGRPDGAPDGRDAALGTPPAEADQLLKALSSSGCSLLVAPGTPSSDPGIESLPPHEVDVSKLGLVIVLGQSPDELRLLRKAVDAGIPQLTTRGGVRGLVRALRDGVPALDIEPLAQNIPWLSRAEPGLAKTLRGATYCEPSTPAARAS